MLVSNVLLLSWTHEGPQIFHVVKFSRFLVQEILCIFCATEGTSYRWVLKICPLSLLVKHCTSDLKNLFRSLRTYTLKNFNAALSRLRQFLATENPFKMMKNAFYFALKALFVLKIFKFLFWLFGYVEKRFD